jgi:hypothetical protein
LCQENFTKTVLSEFITRSSCAFKHTWSTLKSGSHQVQNLVGKPYSTFDPEVKCVLVAIFENDGKTILQPLTTKKELQPVKKLFRNKTLEIWLSNGETSIAQFDVDILKYKQLLQPFSNCQRTRTLIHLENLDSNGLRSIGLSLDGISNEKY